MNADADSLHKAASENGNGSTQISQNEVQENPVRAIKDDLSMEKLHETVTESESAACSPVPLESNAVNTDSKASKDVTRLLPQNAGRCQVQEDQADLRIPREHRRLDDLLSQIPKRAQHGLLMQCDLILTCIDADDQYIALGTNIGLTFLFNRKNRNMQRLKSEASSDVITCIKLHQGVDHQLATGMASGNLCIFLIPNVISVHKKQLQKFDVCSVHRHYITCVEWSTNGMKLFSGDKTGNVVTTEVDFYQGQCKSSILLVELSTEVIQLNYDHKVLLVSTKQRSFVCRLDTTSEIVQIGQQDRKVQGNFGACFIPSLCKVDDAFLYAARPGFRIWLSDIHGTVCNTHIFKEQISAGIKDIPILRPSKIISKPSLDHQFGPLLIYREKQLVTNNLTTVFILDPQRNRIVACQNRLGGIVDVAVHKDELFILRRHAEEAVIRIADEPEVSSFTAVPNDLPLPFINTPVAEMQHTFKQDASEEKKTKTFLKKTLFTPFKKLDNFIQEHKQFSKETYKAQPPRNLSPVIKSSTESTPTKETTEFGQKGSENSSPDLPPVVALDSPDLTVLVFTDGRKDSEAATDIETPDSARSALSEFADEEAIRHCSPSSSTSEKGLGWRTEVTELGYDHSSSADGKDDIVFSHQMPKKKARKKKLKGKELNKETDNFSEVVFDSQITEEDNESCTRQISKVSCENVDDILRRAEEALTSVNKFLKDDSSEDLEKKSDADININLGEKEDSVKDIKDVRNKDFRDSDDGKDLENDNICIDPIEEDSDNNKSFKEKIVSETEIKDLPSETEITDEHTLPKATNKVEAVSEFTSAQKLIEQTRPRDMPSTVLGIGASSSPPIKVAVANSESKNVSCASQSAKEIPHLSSNEADESDFTDMSSESLKQEKHNSVNETIILTSSSLEKKFEDPLDAAERSLDSMTKYHKLPLRKEESMDDFYSKFCLPYSPTESEEALSWTHGQYQSPECETGTRLADRKISSSSLSSGSVAEVNFHKLANSWSEFITPANIYSLGLSSTHVWFTDKSENLYYSALGGTKGILWRKVAEPASQISVSPSGHIVWRLYRGRVFAGTKITHRRPEGLKWVEAVRDVSYISVDDNCAWYVKINGDVMMQRGLSKERPCFRSFPVETSFSVKQLMARHGVVWALTDTMTLLVRTGISSNTPEGVTWQEINRHTEPCLFSSVSIDNEGIGWAVDVLGQIWFTDAITSQNPQGSGRWWQVPLSEYFVQDPTVLDMIRSIAKKFDPQKLSHILTTNRGGLIVAGVQGVWLSLDYRNTLFVCRSSLQGYHWHSAHPSMMAKTTMWKQVHATISHLNWGLVWAQHANGELFTLPPDSTDAVLVAAPVFVSYAVNEHAVWGLTSDGEMFIRTGMGQHCPQGVDWTKLDIVQLGEVHLVHVSCNSTFVWVVDCDGQVFHRIGAAPPRPSQLSPVWLPIDTYSEIVFTKVINGPLDWMVWAVDNRRLTYVRTGISETMPIGKEWIHVPGIQALDITLSSSGVWALNTNGEILFRYGITKEDVSGDYWKKIPGCFTKISASTNDVLWAVDIAGQLVKCSCRHLFRRQESSDPIFQRSISNTSSDDADWEFV